MPGIGAREEITAIVTGVAPKPVNVLVGGATGQTINDLAALGVRRVSVGGALARAAWGGFMQAAKVLSETGCFEWFKDTAPHNALNDFFRKDRAVRENDDE